MALHRDLIGQRVVVRRVLRGQIGPSGGPALSDTLGELTSWSSDAVTVLTAAGDSVTIAQADITNAKPVPPRAPVRDRITADNLQLICARGWQAPVETRLGDWLLRAGAGFTGRANSALLVGDPGHPLGEALARVGEFYRHHDLPVQAQVVVGSQWQQGLSDLGWVRARPGEADAVVQTASVAMARRLRVETDLDPATIDVRTDLTEAWIERYRRAAGIDSDVVRAVLLGADEVGFAQVGDDAHAIGRAALSGDWVGLSAVEVAPDRRRQGLAQAVVVALLGWAASRGARSAYLQAVSSNAAGLALYERFGFTDHHHYRYLRPPAVDES